MNVGELIEKLQTLPPDTHVWIQFDVVTESYTPLEKVSLYSHIDNIVYLSHTPPEYLINKRFDL